MAAEDAAAIVSKRSRFTTADATLFLARLSRLVLIPGIDYGMLFLEFIGLEPPFSFRSLILVIPLSSENNRCKSIKT